MKNVGKKAIIGVILLVLIGAGVYHWLQTRNIESTDDASIEANIIPVASQVSGFVVSINVTDNQHVKKGDIILQIDQRDAHVALEQAMGAYDAAKAKLMADQHNLLSTAVSAPSNADSAQSQVASAEAEWNNTSKTLKRLRSLNDNARSRQSLDDAIAAEKSAKSKLDDAQARLKGAQTAPDTVAASQANVKQTEAMVQMAAANLEKSQNALKDTTLVAAQDGRIARRTVQVGSYVQPGQQLMSIVSDDIWVVGNYKETQLDRMKPGQKVDIKVDAYPDHVFAGKVDSVQAGTGARFSLFPPENATGNFVKIVQRVPVKIIFDEIPPSEYPLGPGMSVVPGVHVP